MKFKKSFIRKAILLTLIGCVGYFGSGSGSDLAYASAAGGKITSVLEEGKIASISEEGEATSVAGGGEITAISDGALYLVKASVSQGMLLATSQQTVALYPFSAKVDGNIRFGYIDGSGNVVIKPSYIIAENFSEGFAVVETDEKYQVINHKGKVVFESEGPIQSFHNGLAAYSDPSANYKRGYINTAGKVIIQSKYDFAGGFRADGTAFVSMQEEYYKINKKGNVLKTYKVNTNYFILDVTDDGYLIVNDQSTYLQGVIDLNNKVILKPAYSEVKYLGYGLFGVKQKVSDMDAYRLIMEPAALFNKEGKQLTSYELYDLSRFNEGYASATDDTSTYFINTKGIKVTKLPILEGRGKMRVQGDIIQAKIDNELIYQKKDGTPIYQKDGITKLASGITVGLVKSRPNKYVVVNYPKIDGISDSRVEDEINQKLEILFLQYRKDLKVEDELSVNDVFTVEQIKDLIIVHKTGYDYPIGAAHGMPFSVYYFVDVKTGTFYEFKDLFKNNSDYVSVLSKMVKKQIDDANKSDYMIYYYDEENVVSTDQSFFISKDTLTIYYDSGAIAAYAVGLPEFRIPFKDIKNIINTEGAFWKSFQ